MLLKQAEGETLEEFQKRKLAFENEQANKGEQISEADYKNLQSFATKSRENEINFAKKLVGIDAKELEGLDVEIQNKVIKDIYGYENMKELKIMIPDIFEKQEAGQTSNVGNFTGEGELAEYKKRQDLLEYKLSQKDLNDEYDKFVSANKSAVDSISDFKTKIFEELQNITSTIPASERMKRATRIVSSSSNIDIETFLSLQGRTTKMTNRSGGSSTENIEKNANILREKLGLKVK